MKTRKTVLSGGVHGYMPGDEVFVAEPRPGDKWPAAFRGQVMAAMGKRVVVTDGVNGWEIPLPRLRRPSFAVCSEDQAVVTDLDFYPAADRTDFMCRLANMVITGVSPSLIVAGDPGIGKTYNVRQEFAKLGLENGDGYYTVKGRILGLGLYKLLYQMNGHVVLFDDADDVFQDKTSKNILKAALDSYDERLISWHTSGADREGLPRCFVFTGAAIFITNLDLSRIDAAVSDRSFRINFTMNNEEALDRIKDVLPFMDLHHPAELDDNGNVVVPETPVAMDMREEVFEYLTSMRDEIAKISFRTMINAVRLRITQEDRWKEMALLFA